MKKFSREATCTVLKHHKLDRKSPIIFSHIKKTGKKLIYIVYQKYIRLTYKSIYGNTLLGFEQPRLVKLRNLEV